MEVVAIGLAVASAYGSIQEGQQKKKYYDQVAQQARIEGERKAIQYEFQANQILQRTNAANAAVIARGFAGGTQGFEGSAALVQAVNNTRGGKEFAFALSNADGTRRNSLIQASLYEQAGKTAEQTGYFNAAGKLGMAALTYGQIGSAPSTPAPVIDKSTPLVS